MSEKDLRARICKLEELVFQLYDSIYIIGETNARGRVPIREVLETRELDEDKKLWTSLWTRLR